MLEYAELAIRCTDQSGNLWVRVQERLSQLWFGTSTGLARRSTPALRNGTGFFTLVFTTLNPHIPVIEEGRLSDPLQAEHFLARVEFFSLWLEEGRGGWTADKITQIPRHQQIVLYSAAHRTQNGTWARLIAQAFDRGDHPENVAFEYMAAAQKSLNVLTSRGQSLMPWNVCLAE